MSEPQSLREEILRSLALAQRPVTSDELYQACKLATTKASLAPLLHEMTKAGEIEKVPVPENVPCPPQTRFAYQLPGRFVAQAARSAASAAPQLRTAPHRPGPEQASTASATGVVPPPAHRYPYCTVDSDGAVVIEDGAGRVKLTWAQALDLRRFLARIELEALCG